MKFYFQQHDEYCYTKAYHLEYMKENEISEMKVFEAKQEKGTMYFFCKKYFVTGYVGEGCGKLCKYYKPRNGKSGRCIYSSHT